MSISEALIPRQSESSDSDSPADSPSASPSSPSAVSEPRRIVPQETQPGETSPTMQPYAQLAGQPYDSAAAAAGPSYFLLAAPPGCGLPPGAMVYIPMSMPIPMQLAAQQSMAAPMLSPRSQLQAHMQLQQSLQALRANLTMSLDQSSGPEGGAAAARVNLAPLLIEDPNSVQTIPSWGPASEMRRRRVWWRLMSVSAIVWMVAIISAASPAVLQCGNTALGYWSSCSGGSCSAYSIEQDWRATAQAFAILSILSATAMLAFVGLAYKTITRATIVHAVGVAATINFLSVLLALTVFTGEMAASACVSGLGYSGGIQIAVLLLDIVVLALCCMHAEPAVTPVRRWDYYIKLMSFPSCAVLALEPVLCSILSAALPSMFEGIKVIAGSAVLMDVGFFQLCSTSGQAGKHCSYWESAGMPAGIQAAQALAILDVLFCTATFCCMLVASRWDSPKAPLLVAVSALLSTMAKAASVETLLAAFVQGYESAVTEFSKLEFGSDSQIAAAGVHLLLATICIVFAAKRQSFVRD